MYQISFYVPLEQLESVKNALFSAGAGQIGPYSHCAWEILGQGQFLPLAGSKPFIGQANQLEKIAEYKVEISCAAEKLEAAIAALIKAHPYETPAYMIVKCNDIALPS